jgi:acetyl-CoA acyltransferase
MTVFGRHPGRSLRDLGREACAAALRDAGIHPRAIQAVYCGNALGSVFQGESGVGQNVAWEIGVHSVPVFNVENACASGSTALHQAWQDVAAGFHDFALVVGVEKAVMPKGTVLNVGLGELETQLGDVFPGMFAMIAQQHMQRYGTTREQMAAVSVKNHYNGSLNPYAQFQKQVTIAEVLASPMIADPVTLYSCCPNSDGAAAVVLCAGDRLNGGRARAIRVAASTLTSGSYDPNRDLTFWDSEARAARSAYEQAGLGPDDLDVLEVHDAFTISEIVHCETLGLCAPGEGGPLVEQGATALGGRIPVNPSGGLQARGHPPGASGVAQVVEIVMQLRGETGARQVQNSRVGLAQIMGGSKEGDARACTVHILMRS